MKNLESNQVETEQAVINGNEKILSVLEHLTNEITELKNVVQIQRPVEDNLNLFQKMNNENKFAITLSKVELKALHKSTRNVCDNKIAITKKGAMLITDFRKDKFEGIDKEMAFKRVPGISKRDNYYFFDEILDYIKSIGT